MALKEIFCVPEGSKVGTFSYDNKLPPLPVPDLDHTLTRYFDSLKVFGTEEQLKRSEELIKQFKNGEGRKLHELVCKRAKKEQNWLDEWWLNYAYLINRSPLLPFCSMVGISALDDLGFTSNPQNAMQYAAHNTYYVCKLWELLRKEQFKPTETADGSTTFTSFQFRNFFNTVRIPGEQMDKIECYFKTEKEGPSPTHVIVLSNGRIYKVNALSQGKLVTPRQWHFQYEYIKKMSNRSRGQCVPILTCDDRTNWAKNRVILQTLSKNNAKNLHIIETALLMNSLDPNNPTDNSDANRLTLSGDYNTRWADKSAHTVIFNNGIIVGLGDHSAYDGTVSIAVTFFSYVGVQENGGDLIQSEDDPMPPPLPEEIEFTLNDHLKNEIARLQHDLKDNQERVLFLTENFNGYGKDFMKSIRLHPDSFIQMALQYTYYKMHGRPAATYETASTRKFYNGRTETVRSCTVEAVKWVESMLDNKTDDKIRIQLLQTAIKKQDLLMKEARENAGCDRHLFGLYITALENQLPVPELFNDELFTKSGGNGNFVLSTSLSGYTTAGGGVAPMVKDGYGAFYNILPNEIRFNITSFRDSFETSPRKYFNTLCENFMEMKELFKNDINTTSKL